MSRVVRDGSLRAKAHFTVLLTSPNTNVILVNALREAAKSAELNLKIIACDRQPRKSPASLLSDAAYELPRRSDEAYVQAIIDVCVVHRVDLVLPVASIDVAILTRNRSSIESVGAALALCGHPLIIAAEQWSRSAQTRKTELEGRCSPCQPGCSSQHFRIVLYFDRSGALRTIIPCERLIEEDVEHLVTRRDLRIVASVRRQFAGIGSAQSIVTIDAALDACGELIIEEVRLDLADTVEIAHKAGAPLVRWLLQEHAGLKAEPNDAWREGVEMLRYSAAIYLLPVEGESESRSQSG